MLKKILAGFTTAAVIAGMPVTSFAAASETPSGIPVGEVGSRIAARADGNASEYTSFAVAVVTGEERVD